MEVPAAELAIDTEKVHDEMVRATPAECLAQLQPTKTIQSPVYTKMDMPAAERAIDAERAEDECLTPLSATPYSTPLVTPTTGGGDKGKWMPDQFLRLRPVGGYCSSTASDCSTGGRPSPRPDSLIPVKVRSATKSDDARPPSTEHVAAATSKMPPAASLSPDSSSVTTSDVASTSSRDHTPRTYPVYSPVESSLDTTPRMNSTELRSMAAAAISKSPGRMPPADPDRTPTVTPSESVAESASTRTTAESTPRSARLAGGGTTSYLDQLHRNLQRSSGSGSSIHDRKSRSVSPNAAAALLGRQMTPDDDTAAPDQDAARQDGRKRWTFAGRSPSPLGSPWTRSESSDVDQQRFTSSNPRHVTEYKNCVLTDADAARPSSRGRDDTYRRLFAPSSPRSPDAADQQQQQQHPHRKNAEDTQANLFGPAPEYTRRPSSRNQVDTHLSLFGPPPAFVPRRNRSCFQDSPDLLRHDAARADPTSTGRVDALRARYSLRHEDTSEKLFGSPVPLKAPPPVRPTNIFPVCDAAATPRSAPPPASSPAAEPVA